MRFIISIAALTLVACAPPPNSNRFEQTIATAPTPKTASVMYLGSFRPDPDGHTHCYMNRITILDRGDPQEHEIVACGSSGSAISVIELNKVESKK